MYDETMHVLFVTSEVAGFFKLGGLADVSAALPPALTAQGVSVTVSLPFYKTIDVTGVKGVGELAVDYRGKREIVFLFTKQWSTDGGDPVRLLLFRHPMLDEYQSPTIAETFAFYSKVISTFYLYSKDLLKPPVDIIHCHDWHTALVPLLLGESNKRHHQKDTIQSQAVHTIVTIHNLLYKGVANIDIADYLDAPCELFHVMKKGPHESFSFLREGLEHADAITTVSPTYAKEIIAAAHHDALGDVLPRRRATVTGILNGIDEHQWNPATDQALAYHYTEETASAIKPRLKKSLQDALGLPKEEAIPLLGFVGRIEPRQKGIDIVIEALKDILPTKTFQMVILGTGDARSITELKALARQHKKYLAMVHAFDDGLARRIYGGSDVFLVPSRFEPCGLTQMIAMRYGSVPLVRQTGGLADTVTEGITGFVFEPYSGHALASTIKRAILVWNSDKAAWKSLVCEGMRQDFSWDGRAREYIALYRKLIL